MKRLATILLVSVLSVGAFAQSNGKLKVNVSSIVQGSSTTSQVKTQTGNTIVQAAPTRSTIASQLAPPNRNQVDNRGEPVPEPATMAVIGVGIAALLRRKRAS